MASKNTGEEQISLSKIVVDMGYDADRFEDWLDDENNYGTTVVKVKGQPIERRYRRTPSVTVQEPPALYVAHVQHAASIPGMLNDGDLTSGVLARVARRPLFVSLMGWKPEQADAWETERAKAISEARADRMSTRAAVTAETSAKASQFDKLAAMAASNPELAALLAQLDTES